MAEQRTYELAVCPICGEWDRWYSGLRKCAGRAVGGGLLYARAKSTHEPVLMERVEVVPVKQHA